MQINNTEMAKEYAEKALEINNEEDLHQILAEVYTKEKNLEKAIQKYNYLILKNPKNINYTIGLTNIYITQKKYLEARKTLKNYFKHNPKDKNNPRFKSYGILKIFL